MIGFEGKKLGSFTFDLVANPFDEDSKAPEANVEVYRTRAGKFVLLAVPQSYTPESASAFALWETHDSLTDVMGGNVVSCMFPPDRHELLTLLTASLGKDAVKWID